MEIAPTPLYKRPRAHQLPNAELYAHQPSRSANVTHAMSKAIDTSKRPLFTICNATPMQAVVAAQNDHMSFQSHFVIVIVIFHLLHPFLDVMSSLDSNQ